MAIFQKRARFWTLVGTYFFASVLLMVPSMFFWRTVPFRLTKNEFDFFLGLIPPSSGFSSGELLQYGKIVHFVLFGIVGWTFFKLIVKYGDEVESLSNRAIIAMALAASLVYFIGLPWVSPDVFYYIAKGWMEANYQLDIYSLALKDSPGFPGDEMYVNVIPSFANWPGNYGPLHQNISATVASLSGGSVKLALLLLKALNVVLYLGSAFLTAAIARHQGMGYRRVFVAYALNPLGLFALVTCVHNDALQNLLLMLALYCVITGRAAASGATLGAALAYKYVAIALAPALVLACFFRTPPERRWRDAAYCTLSLIGVVLACHLLYAGSFGNMIKIYVGGWSPLRASIYYLLLPLNEFLNMVPVHTMERTLTLGFVVAGGVISILPHFRNRQWKVTDLSRQWFWIFAVYFLTAVAVLEWYLTWLIGFGLVVNSGRYLRGVMLLTCSYLPLVIFTIRSGNEIPANQLLYVVMVACLLSVLWRGRATVPPSEGEIANPPAVAPMGAAKA